MIRDRAAWRAWEMAYIAREPPDFWKNLQIVEGLYAHARMLDKFPMDASITGIETVLKIARVVNVPTTAGKEQGASQC